MKITKIELLNRGDCCPERLANHKIIIGDGDTYKPVEIGTTHGRSGWEAFNTDMVGSYLKV